MATGTGNIEIISEAALSRFNSQLNPTTPGHQTPHFRNVAQLSQIAGLAAGYQPREIELAVIAGWYHDAVKFTNQAGANSEEALSARVAVSFTEELDQQGIFPTTPLERQAVSTAILKHRRPPQFFAERPDPKQWTLDEKLQAALFTADKMEANGVWVIARRPQVVAGTRLHDKEDLPKYGLQPDRDENKAVLLEGALRIAFINPEGIYPPIFRPLTSKMYGPQRDFMHGLLAAEGLSIYSYAKFLLETKDLTDPQHSLDYLQTNGFKFLSIARLAKELRVIGGLSGAGISQAQGDLANSAVEAVAYFSGNYQASLEELVQKWNPRYNVARLWHADMLKYVSGEWFEKIKADILSR